MSTIAVPRLSARTVLLACGIASSIAYVFANIAAGATFEGYSITGQTISELSAIGAPSRGVWLAFGIPYDLLLVAFGVGLWRCGPRVSAACLIAIGALGPFWPPMHLRGSVITLTDTLHVVFASVVSILTLVAIGAGASAIGRRFRLYSIVTFAVMIVCGALTFRLAPGVAANLPTPGIGIYERIVVGGFTVWVAVLAIALLREERA
jgi:hypothetical protein